MFPGVIRVSLVIEAIGRNDLIFKRANSQEEPVLADSSSSGENRCRGDETRDKHCHYRGSGELKTRLHTDAGYHELSQPIKALIFNFMY